MKERVREVLAWASGITAMLLISFGSGCGDSAHRPSRPISTETAAPLGCYDDCAESEAICRSCAAQQRDLNYRFCAAHSDSTCVAFADKVYDDALDECLWRTYKCRAWCDQDTTALPRF